MRGLLFFFLWSFGPNYEVQDSFSDPENIEPFLSYVGRQSWHVCGMGESMLFAKFFD